MTQNTNQITKNQIKTQVQSNCDYELALLKSVVNLLRETIDLIVSEDFDIDNQKNLATLLINLIIAEADVEFSLKCFLGDANE